MLVVQEKKEDGKLENYGKDKYPEIEHLRAISVCHIQQQLLGSSSTSCGKNVLDQPLLIANPEYGSSLACLCNSTKLASKSSSGAWYEVPSSLSSDTLDDLSDHVANAASEKKVTKLSFPLTIPPSEG